MMNKQSIHKSILILGFIFQTYSVNSQTLLGNSQFYHSFSGTNFPHKIGNFEYTWPQQYDDLGKDISVSFIFDNKGTVSQYIYPSKGQNLAKHFDDYKNSLLSHKSKSKLLSTDKIVTKGISGYVSKLEFIEDLFGKEQMVLSYLYIYESLGWFVMIRCTSQIEDRALIEKEIKEYVSKMPFPTIKY